MRQFMYTLCRNGHKIECVYFAEQFNVLPITFNPNTIWGWGDFKSIVSLGYFIIQQVFN